MTTKDIFNDQKKSKIKGHRLHTHHFNYLLLIVCVLVIVILVLLKPAFIGHSLQQQFDEKNLTAEAVLNKIDSLELNNTILKQELNQSKERRSECFNKLEKEQNKTLQLKKELRTINSQMQELRMQQSHNISRLKMDYQGRIDKLQHNLSMKTQSYEQLKNDYNTIIKNSARRICCKQKVDNPSIDSFYISDNTINCGYGRENGIEC